jgi:hypothetical protein
MSSTNHVRGSSVKYGVGAPKNTPTQIVEKLNKETVATLADPKLKHGLPTWARASHIDLADSRACRFKT